MKKALLLSVAIVCVASMALAQGGGIGIFADPTGADCNLWDVAPGLVTYWAVHVNTPGATACSFSAPQPACGLMAYLSDTQQFPVTIGNSQDGVAIGYGGCFASPIAVLAINFFAQALTAPCCFYPVLPDPNGVSGQIEVVDCADNLLIATGGAGRINPNSTCMCTVATEETTWGQVKSLYAN